MASVLSRIFWSGLDAAVYPITTLVLTAGLVRHLGDAGYGIFVAAFAVSNLAAATNVAISSATLKLIAEVNADAAKKGELLARRIGTLLALVLAADLILVAGGWAFSTPIAGLVFGGGPNLRPDLPRLLGIALLTVALQQIDAVLASVLKGLERLRVQSSFEALSKVALTAGLIGAAVLSRDVAAVLNAYAIGLALSVVLRGVLVVNAARIQWRWLAVDREVAFSVLKFGSWMWLFAMGSMLYANLDKVLIGRHAGTAQLGEYNVYLQLAQLIQFIPAGIFAFAMPAFARMNAQGRIDDLRRAFKKLLLATSGIAIAGGVGLLIAYEPIVGLYFGRPGTLGRTTEYLAVATFTIHAFSLAPMFVLMALGESRAISMVNLACTVGMALIALFLIPKIGVDGGLWARLFYVAGLLLMFRLAAVRLRQR